MKAPGHNPDTQNFVPVMETNKTIYRVSATARYDSDYYTKASLFRDKADAEEAADLLKGFFFDDAVVEEVPAGAIFYDVYVFDERHGVSSFTLRTEAELCDLAKQERVELTTVHTDTGGYLDCLGVGRRALCDEFDVSLSTVKVR